MGGGGSTETVYVPQYIYQNNPETDKKLAEVTQKLQEVEKEAQERGDPKHYQKNADKLFDTFVGNLDKLELTEFIVKKTGETHVGLIGGISCGKSTMLNSLFNLKLPVALGHCTTECTPVHKVVNGQSAHIYWDVPGKDGDFKFFKPENLNFLKGLDICAILFDDDTAPNSNVIRVADKVCDGKIILVRTKLDQYNKTNVRTPAEEKARDQANVRALLGKDVPIYYTSSHNVVSGGDLFDWEAFKKEILP